MKGTKRLAVLAMFTAIALTIFVAEAQNCFMKTRS